MAEEDFFATRDVDEIVKEKYELADNLDSLNSSTGSHTDDDDRDSAGTEPCAEIGERLPVSRDEDGEPGIIEAALGAQRSIDELIVEKTVAADAEWEGMEFERDAEPER